MAATRTFIRQAAAIAVHEGRVCLVTSSSGKRWVIPKGCCEPGKTTAQIALQEAWEEAGVAGILQREPVGSYLYKKDGGTYDVTVYLLHVTSTAADWPERLRRRRCWLSPERAARRLTEDALSEMIRSVLLAGPVT